MDQAFSRCSSMEKAESSSTTCHRRALCFHVSLSKETETRSLQISVIEGEKENRNKNLPKNHKEKKNESITTTLVERPTQGKAAGAAATLRMVSPPTGPDSGRASPRVAGRETPFKSPPPLDDDDDDSSSAEEELPRELAERYELRERIGTGSYSVVLRATDRRSGEGVAVKIVSTAETPPEAVDREIRNMRRVPDHPNILRLHDVFKTPKVRSVFRTFFQLKKRTKTKTAFIS